MSNLTATKNTYRAAQTYLANHLTDMEDTGVHIRGKLDEMNDIKVYITGELTLAANVYHFENMKIDRYQNVKMADIRSIVATYSK